MNNKFKTVSLNELQSIVGGRHSAPYRYGYQVAKGIKGGVVAYNILKTIVSVL